MKKYTSGATTAAGVALANLNSLLWVAFPGGGGLGAAAPNFKLNIMPVDPENPNDAWSFDRLLVLDNETTTQQPALTAFGGKLWLAWAGTDAAHRLNLLPLTVSADNHLSADMQHKITFNWTATGGPSLAVRQVWIDQKVQQQLCLAFCGGGGLGAAAPNGELNFAYSVDGFGWPQSQLTVWNQYHSLLSPSLTEVPIGTGLPTEPPYMFVAFTGTDTKLYLSGPNGYLSGLKYIGDNDPETSNYAAAIGAYNNAGTWALFYVWTGSGSNRHLYYQEGLGFSTQSANYHSAYSDTSEFAPAVLGVDWHRYVAWAGTDAAHRLNIAEFSELQTIPS
jgi:hypothetical protein